MLTVSVYNKWNLQFSGKQQPIGHTGSIKKNTDWCLHKHNMVIGYSFISIYTNLN